MSETPRLRSAFPNTPQPKFGRRGYKENAAQNYPSPQPSTPSSSRPSPVTRPAQSLPGSQHGATGPLVPLDFIDAPTQRFYVVAFYIALTAWRIYNSWQVQDDLDSTWLFLKWIGIDAAFFVALPAFHIPWLEFSFLTTLTLWLLHAVVNAFLMYKIPVPIASWIAALLKVAYDRELSISEHRVKPADILHNSSIILGKQIIQILPEGSAIFNPEKLSYCLDLSRPSAELPIRINQTTPISIELIRYDLETDEEESVIISAKQIRQMKRQADKGHPKSETNTPRTLHYSVSKRGLYRLEKVVDESKLEVRRRNFDLAVVRCPQASVAATVNHRCAGELSHVSLDVTGVPPFKVRYSKRINQQQFSSIEQNIQATGDSTIGEEGSQIVADPRKPHMGWTQSQTVSVDINEALHQNGTWTYTVEDVEDGLGNKVVYGGEKSKELVKDHRSQSLTVHNRPVINLVGCSVEHPLRLARGQSINLPIRVQPKGQLHSSDWPLKLKYTFVPETEDGGPMPEQFNHEMTNEAHVPSISRGGIYTLEKVESQYCRGEVVEPSSCSLYNPPMPGLTIESENIFDKCAGNPIGMLINLDFTGTPPFTVHYAVTHGGKTTPKHKKFDSMRGQLEFRETSAGSYSYQFARIEDSVYGSTSIKGDDLVLKQDIKPPASASFQGNGVSRACLGQAVDLSVKFYGDGPWDLDYEIIHDGKRKKHTAHSEIDVHTITLPEQTEGGKYSVVLTGVQDRAKCRVPLRDERQIEVRSEQSKAAFGLIDSKQSVLALEGKVVKLPLRLKGSPPWMVRIQNTADGSAAKEHILREPNEVISVDRPGKYEILSVSDGCPGVVDAKASVFTVSTIPRPTFNVRDINHDGDNSRSFQKSAVCQGDESSLSLGLSGTPPFHLKYQQKLDATRGPAAISNKDLTFASRNAVINLDTNKPGQYTYTFSEIRDDRYAHDKRHFKPMTVKQEVYAPPTAKFSTPGKTYGYCKDDSEVIDGIRAESEHIPITLIGSPPFSLEIAITHHGVSTRPEIIRIKDIESTTYSWAISRSSLELGTHVISIRAVKDGRGCENIIDQDSSSIRVSVSSPPIIIPLESNTDFCVGDHVSFSLSGQAPFEVYYQFQNRERKARVTSNEFKRIAESPGNFVITGISDSAMGSGKCKARKDITKTIHPFPSVRIDRGRTVTNEIHEGGEVEILFDFTGTPPFEFTYTRSENVKKGQKARVLETRHDTSYEFSKTVRASDEGVYEVVAIKDKYCAYASPNHAASTGGKVQKLLT